MLTFPVPTRPATGHADLRHPRLPATNLEDRLRHRLAEARRRKDLLAVATLETRLAAFECPCSCHPAARCPGACGLCFLNHRPMPSGRAA